MELVTEARCVADVRALLGEGPVWVLAEQALYWVDIKGKRIFRLSEGDELCEWEAPFQIGALVPRLAGGFFAGTDQGLADVDLAAQSFTIFCNPEADRPSNRFNDGKVDREGRYWAGSMDDEERVASGALYRISADRSWARCDDKYRVANGPAFSPDGRVMYHNDSARQLTYVFDLDEWGTPSNRRVFSSFEKGEGYPDGMTVDGEGCLWIAFWDGWCLRRFSPAGERLATLRLPVQRPTSCAFGGEALDHLYVTSARVGLSDAALNAQPCAGGLFVLETGVSGLAELPFAG
ncbi:MAG TPA: SMP-30/gluconolactonase/LRE family protein [Sphingomicrobium sp.]|nr:SMP-30/gluconolactonase/LRE family protein [Sphingomicrobium sp.]